MSTDIQTEVLTLAKKGFTVLPCRPSDKRSATPNGCKDATTDPEEIERLFQSDHNVGISCGQAPGVWVLDLDGPEGIEAWNRWKTAKKPFTTATVKTGRGRHLYFKLNGEPIRNRTKVVNDSIDVRGEGGYVIAPPSKHENGTEYTWEVGPQHLAEAPDWLIEKITSERSSHPSSFQVDSLASHPGSAQGDRHGTLLRLVGRELALGNNTQEIIDNPDIGRWELHQAVGKNHKAELIARLLGELRDEGRISVGERETMIDRLKQKYNQDPRLLEEVDSIKSASLQLRKAIDVQTEKVEKEKTRVRQEKAKEFRPPREKELAELGKILNRLEKYHEKVEKTNEQLDELGRPVFWPDPFKFIRGHYKYTQGPLAWNEPIEKFRA